MDSQSFDIAAELVLEHLSQHLPLALWSVTRVENNRQTFLYLNEGNGYGIVRGDSTPWQDTFCVHMVEGRTPAVTSKPRKIPEYKRAAEVNDLEIGTYAGVAIRESNGTLFGTICGFDPESRLDADERARAMPLLTFMGEMLTLALSADRDRDRMNETLAASEYEAETDALTGLTNRRGWDRVVGEEEGRFRRLADPTVVMIVDLDGLKAINDGSGHAAGDGYLQQAAKALNSSVRSTDVIARIGGDEFALLLRQCDIEGATLVAAKVEGALAANAVEASLGWASVGVQEGLRAAISTADAAMYAAKEARRVRATRR